MNRLANLPIVVIGAGPIGLAAASHLAERGLPMAVLERGPAAGHAVRAWGHVRVFTPWSLNLDESARRLLEGTRWRAPDPEALPTGDDLVNEYLEPLSNHPDIAPFMHTNAQVMGVTRAAADQAARCAKPGPFTIHWRDELGGIHALRARAVIDASGTWFSPNPMGIDGKPVPGEAEAADRIAYGIPDVLSKHRARYAGARILVLGGGHSAMNVVLDLMRLREDAPDTLIFWAFRRSALSFETDDSLNARLAARQTLNTAAAKAAAGGEITVLAPFAAESIESHDSGLRVSGRHNGTVRSIEVDRIVVATGFRPDLGLVRELRIALDPELEAPPALVPLIDPRFHSCGTVPAHGASALEHPEPGVYIVGSKSYGRAPNFLLANGFIQVRSVVAVLAGEPEAARVSATSVLAPGTSCCAPPGQAPTACSNGRATSCC